MGALADRAAGQATEDDGTPPSALPVARILDSLDEADRTLLEGWLAAPIPPRGSSPPGTVGSSWITDQLREAGHPISERSVRNYRRWMQARSG